MPQINCRKMTFPVHHATEQIHAGTRTYWHEGPNWLATNVTTVKSAMLLQSISASRPIEHVAFTNRFQVLFVAQLSHAHSDPQSKHLEKQTSKKRTVQDSGSFMGVFHVSPEWHLTLLASKARWKIFQMDFKTTLKTNPVPLSIKRTCQKGCITLQDHHGAYLVLQ